MYSFPHVEDYIEIIAGFREPNGKSNHNIFTVADPIISLARYDMKVVPSLAEQTIGQRGYTDKQARLATDLVLKYERQLAKHNIDITPVKTPQYRLPIREIDRTSRIWIEDDSIKVKFPFNPNTIDLVRTASKESKGSVMFNRDTRVYDVALTEWNLNWFYSFAVAEKFDIDKSVTDVMALITAVESTTYKVELNYDGDNLTITNAPTSLIEYINENLGGFKLENILKLLDYAPILGYTVNTNVEADVIRNFNNRFWSLCANRTLKVDPALSNSTVKEIVEYARLTDRFPIYVYEADLSDRLLTEFNKFFVDQIVRLDRKEEITADTRVVYTTKIPRAPVTDIPLLISSAGMLFGGDRQMWIQTAEKIVYFTKDVYTKSPKAQEIKSI